MRALTPVPVLAALALMAHAVAIPIAPGRASATETTAEGARVTLLRASVKPRRAFFDAAGGVRVSFRFTADQPTDAAVRFVHGGRVLRRFELRELRPGVDHALRWNGLTSEGMPAPEGGHKAIVVFETGRPAGLGRVRLRHYMFPVRGPHGARGPIGEFGASRSGGRVHEGFDVTAACGTHLVAARGGTVARRGYDPVLYGNFVLIRGRKSRRSFFYSHLSRPASVLRGERVRTGERIGRVGRTGNARSTPCHLHFEIRRRGRLIDPEPWLRRWDRYS